MTGGRKSCKGECQREHWIHLPATTRYLREVYERGYRRCRVCNLYITGFLDCPCCGLTLKAKPRVTKYRRRYNERVLKVVSY